MSMRRLTLNFPASITRLLPMVECSRRDWQAIFDSWCKLLYNPFFSQRAACNSLLRGAGNRTHDQISRVTQTRVLSTTPRDNPPKKYYLHSIWDTRTDYHKTFTDPTHFLLLCNGEVAWHLPMVRVPLCLAGFRAIISSASLVESPQVNGQLHSWPGRQVS